MNATDNKKRMELLDNMKMTWTREDSNLIYGLDNRDLKFLKIGKNGDLELSIDESEVTLQEVIESVIDEIPELRNRSSFTLRLPQLIHNQIDRILDTFAQMKSTHQYSGDFQPLYPIKVNQRKQVIEAILEDPSYGLEAGTKSELMLILQTVENQKDRVIMCNGVKDREYLSLVRDAIDSGYNILLSIESVTEMRGVINMFDPDEIQLFLRIKPYVSMYNYGHHSVGRNSKFGLMIGEIFKVLDILTQNHFESSLVGIHAHPGSQISNFYEFKQYFGFMTNSYIKLHKMGFDNMNSINFGGGLPVNYDGRLPKDTVKKYARHLISTILQSIDEVGIDHPNILIESGRFVTASSAMLVIQPLELQHIYPSFDDNDKAIGKLQNQVDAVETLDDIFTLWQQHENLSDTSDFETLLQHEKLTGWLKSKLREKFFQLPFSHEQLKSPIVNSLISTDYMLLGNFSVFNGVCDYVMTNQYFPVLPISHLDKQPETLIRLVDITCDSDGEISIYRTRDSDAELFTVDGYPLTAKDPLEWRGFPIGSIQDSDQNHLVVPLIGAYQDIIEFDHNLLGNLPDIEITLDDGNLKVELIKHAKTNAELAADVGYLLQSGDRTPYIDVTRLYL